MAQQCKVWVTHRLSWCVACSRVVVTEKGGISGHSLGCAAHTACDRDISWWSEQVQQKRTHGHQGGLAGNVKMVLAGKILIHHQEGPGTVRLSWEYKDLHHSLTRLGWRGTVCLRLHLNSFLCNPEIGHFSSYQGGLVQDLYQPS